jgi:hypothetical protein
MKFLLIIAAWVMLAAQSPVPPPSPTENAQEKQNVSRVENAQPNPTNSPAQPSAATGHQSTPAPTQSNTNKKGSVSDKPSTINWILILGVANTVLLLLFNGILACVAIYQYQLTHKQADLTEKGLTETRRAADAAKTSADASTQAVENAQNALYVTERALIKIETVALRGDPESIDGATAVHFKIKNFGRTVASDVVLTGNIESGGKRRALTQTPGIIIASQGHNFWTSHSLGMFLDGADIFAICDRTAGLTYEIEATYWDVFGKKHHYRASGFWSHALRRFNIITDTTD